MERLQTTIVALGFTSLACLVSCAAWSSAQTSEGCAPSAPTRVQGTSNGPHTYFEALVARPDCMAAFSLRDNAQLKKYSNSKSKPQRVTYDPTNDSDPRRQDAAKVVLAAGSVSLGNTVRLPIGTSDGTSTLVTWDAWFGKEFAVSNTGIGAYKTFQFSSPNNRIWFEVRTRLSLNEARQAKRPVKERQGPRALRPDQQVDSKQRAAGGQSATAPGTPSPRKAPEVPPSVPSARREDSSSNDRAALGVVDARGYPAGGTVLGPNVMRDAPLSPQAGRFTIRAETWTRYWVLIEQRADDWDLMSLWVADEDHDPVLIIDRLQFNVKKSVDKFWLEYNTSAHARPGLGERIGYARNVVMLRNVKDVSSLMQRPEKQSR